MRDDWTKLIAENDQLHLFEPGREEVMRAHVEAHREFVEWFQRLVREAKRPLAYPGAECGAAVFDRHGGGDAEIGWAEVGTCWGRFTTGLWR